MPASMSKVQFKDDETACIVCFCGKKKCLGLDKSCCPGSHVEQQSIPASPFIYNEACKSHIIDILHETNLGDNLWLTRDTASSRTLHIELTSNSNVSSTQSVAFIGAFSTSNTELSNTIDKLVRDRWAPHVELNDDTALSVASSCLLTGYLNVLFWGDIQAQPSSQDNRHKISAVLAGFMINRIDELLVEVRSLFRYGKCGLDAESRPAVDVLYIYLSGLYNKLKTAKRLKIFNDRTLFNHVKRGCNALGNELKMRLEADCKNNLNWAAAFKLSRRGLRAELESMEPWTMSLEIVCEGHQAGKHSSPPLPSDPDTSQPPTQDRDDQLLGSSNGYPKADFRCPHELQNNISTVDPSEKLKLDDSTFDGIVEDNAMNDGTVTIGLITQVSAGVSSGSNLTSFAENLQSHDTFNESHKRNFERFQEDYGFIDVPVSRDFLDVNSTLFDDALRPSHLAGHHFDTYGDFLSDNTGYGPSHTYQNDGSFADFFDNQDLHPGLIDTHDRTYVGSRLLYPEP